MLTALEAGRQIKAPTASVSGENPLPGYRPRISHWVLPQREGPEKKSLHFFIRWLLPNPLPKPHLLTTTLGARMSAQDWGAVGGRGHKHSAHSSKVSAECPELNKIIITVTGPWGEGSRDLDT